ncbi:similar to Saccharomyces cerevisiae YBL035C POL12 B subunit of DNA polymerase alpha-primase complex [Maudiozyma saulgeensis]|uniref:DNA polymerase alpha subunit B n=1 Tax=Maudiozyma saulgeensis TaxID=1789683 RepID=A0A1X7R547_9SACH|nr:similar to Saccharomyces cerevisiae YBL035C POL12 B subunit of DNA polymerase alpha-primase complex [Kazachstania saulgeensis]
MEMIKDSEEIIVKFGSEANQPEIIFGLHSLAKLHAISIEDLYIKWEQFACQKPHVLTRVTVKSLEPFKRFLQEEIEKRANSSVGNISNNSNQLSGPKRPKMLKGINNSSSLFGFNISKTPIANKKRKLGVSNDSHNSDSSIKLEFPVDDVNSTPKSKGEMSFAPIKSESNGNISLTKTMYSSEKTGKIMDSLNPENMEIAEGYTLKEDDTIDSHVRIQLLNDPEKYKFRTMRQNLIECSDVLDEQIELFTKFVKEHLNISDAEFGDPTIQSQADVYAIGRIVPDSPQYDGFLNTESLALETSRLNGIGRRVRLNLEQVKEVSLFCGQIAVLKGKNANGDYFLVDKILDIPYPDFPLSSSEELSEYSDLMNKKSSKVIITSGPYIPDNSFDLSYLTNFVEKINSEIRPHILVMTGPFIDITHPTVMSGNIPHFDNLKAQPATLNELFVKLISPILKKINSSIQVILTPSTRDVMSTHASYPQDSFDRKILQLPKNFKCFTNPTTFQLNETYFGNSNVDIFKDMKEVTKGGETTMSNRFDRVAQHVLQQRRYYPQFPGSIKKMTIAKPNSKDSKSADSKIYKHISGADLEIAYLGLTEFVSNITPDIIIIPSELLPFARVVKNVIMINPGKFVKPNGANGTYAQISIRSPNVNDGSLTEIPGEENLYLHNVWKRSRVDIVTN